MDLGGLQGLVQAQGRQNGGNPLREHGLSGTGRSDQDRVVSSGSRYFQRPLDVLLTLDV